MFLPYIDLHAATTLGIGLCSVFIGANLCISTIVIPTLLLASTKTRDSTKSDGKNGSTMQKRRPVTSDEHLARQWQHIYDIGSRAGPVLAVGSLLSFALAATRLPASESDRRLLLWAASALCPMIAPFTFTFMLNTNNELHAQAKAADAGSDIKASSYSDKESHRTTELLQHWAKLNLM